MHDFANVKGINSISSSHTKITSAHVIHCITPQLYNSISLLPIPGVDRIINLIG